MRCWVVEERVRVRIGGTSYGDGAVIDGAARGDVRSDGVGEAGARVVEE